MPRFYVPQPQIENELLRVTGGEAKHIQKVLRLRKGNPVTIFDGSGKEYEGSITEATSSSVMIKIENTSPLIQEEPLLKITLAQSLLKGEKMDYVIQKATELGANEIVPFYSSRSVPLIEKSKQLERHHRWEKIAIEASKQCGRGVLPRIRPLQGYSEMLRSVSSNGLRLILWEKEGARLKKVLEESEERESISFIVGPEGGLSEEEVNQSKKRGFVPVTLGKRILRAETASLSVLTILQYTRGDIG